MWESDWFPYLQSLSNEELARTLSLDLNATEVWKDAKASFDEWEANKSAGEKESE